MKNSLKLVAAFAFFFGVLQSHGQSVTINFQDGTDDGFGLKFSNDASASFMITNIGGSLRMAVPRTGAFQEADIASGANPFLAAMNAAVANPTGYLISYDWYVDTSLSPGNNGNFLQLATYINSGSGAYAQDFPATGKDVELSGTQLASGQVFSGTVSETVAAKYGTPGAGFLGQTFMRFGFIENGDGTGVTVFYDNIVITPIPEPSPLSLLGLAAIPAFWMLRRRSARC